MQQYVICTIHFNAILNISENASPQYFILCEKVMNQKYILKLNNVFQASGKRRNSTNLSLLMSELCSFLCLMLYSLNFAIAHAQKRLYAYQNSSYLCCINTQANCLITKNKLRNRFRIYQICKKIVK